MGFYDGPSIVTNGLVLSLDAADRNSYPGSGTVWSDLTGNLNSGSLVNGPVFNSAFGGSIVFDGIDDHVSGSQRVSFPTGTQALTMEAWVNVQDTGTGTIFGYGDNSSNGTRMELGVRASNFIVVAINGSAYGFSDATNLNNWIHLVAIPGTLNSQSIIYKNTVQQSLSLQAGTDLTRNVAAVTFYNIGITPASSTATCLSGSVAIVKLYNRALSATEITQNYNAQKSRFGL